jgi:hypothetical protein
VQCSHVVVRNGRRFLSRAAAEVNANLRITQLNRKKAKLLEVFSLCSLLQSIRKTLDDLQLKLDDDMLAEGPGVCVGVVVGVGV